ncbi:MAG: flagellar basal body rod protein FlgC [Ignavibacteria bacterium]
MKISNNFFGIKISSAGLNVQRKKMNLIAENLANTGTTKMQNGAPYQRKFIVVSQQKSGMANIPGEFQNSTLPLKSDGKNHFSFTPGIDNNKDISPVGLDSTEYKDNREGDVVYQPEHPDADSNGYLHMPNVNVVIEMVDMIAATRSYESNLTAFNSSKQMAKDAMEI